MVLTIWSGLTSGAIYALVAAGFSVSLIPSGVFNFAQGALVVGGAFFAYYLFSTLSIPVGAVICLEALAGVVLGTLCEFITVRPLRLGRVVSSGPSSLVTTVGMATVLIGAYGVHWGYTPLTVPFHGPTKVFHALGVRVAPVEVVLVLGAIVVAVGLYAWFRLTRLGHACLAIAEDRDAAMLRGINVNLLSTAGFAAAGALAGLSAIAVGPITYAVPTLADSFALGGFVAIAIGGEGSFLGGLLGGLLVGVVSSIASRYLGSSYANISIFCVLLVTLAIRPKGIGNVGTARNV